MKLIVHRSWEEVPKQPASPGFIYLMKPKGSNGAYKIGTSVNVEKRRNQKQKNVDYEIEVVLSVPVKFNYATEARLHDYFSRVRLAGEWFALSDFNIENFKHIVEELDK